ncbi:MAG: DinB family protein [Terracidiphilus sp.]|jgi:hypothetical protein
MNETERATLLGELDQGKADILRAMDGVTEEMAARSTSLQRWSILECMEHIAISEEYLFGQILAAHRSDAPTASAKRESAIRVRGLDRTQKVPAPEVVKPVGEFSSLSEALKRFLAARERTIRFVETCQEDLRSQITTHPLVGPVNCYETLLTMAMHPIRHARQIEEAKLAAGS